MRRAAVLSLALATLALVSCHKRKRLTESDFDFRISPPASTLVKGSTVTLTAVAGSAEVNPTWSVSGVGTLSSDIGRQVDFSSDKLGDTTVTAIYDGVATNAQIAVVAFIPTVTSSFFNVYTDAGLPSGTGILSDIDAFGGSGPPTLAELSTGYTPEGIRYQQTVSPVDTFTGWAVTLDKNSTGLHEDLSAFSSGRLRFSIRLHRVLTINEEVQVGIDDTLGAPGADGHVALVANSYMSGQSTDWQDVSVPISALQPSQNLTLIKLPFSIVLLNTAAPITFDIDAVRWEK